MCGRIPVSGVFPHPEIPFPAHNQMPIWERVIACSAEMKIEYFLRGVMRRAFAGYRSRKVSNWRRKKRSKPHRKTCLRSVALADLYNERVARHGQSRDGVRGRAALAWLG